MGPEHLAAMLRAALPEVEPFDLGQAELSAALAAHGADPDDDALVAATLVAWEALLP